MRAKSVSLEIPPALLELGCRFAAERGETLSEFLLDGVQSLIRGEDLEEWRRTNGQVAIEEYEREFGAFPEDELEAARRAWRPA
jgi:hypothetical protein